MVVSSQNSFHLSDSGPVPPQQVQEPSHWVHSLSAAISGLAQKIDAVGNRDLGAGTTLEAEPAWVQSFSSAVEGFSSLVAGLGDRLDRPEPVAQPCKLEGLILEASDKEMQADSDLQVLDALIAAVR